MRLVLDLASTTRELTSPLTSWLEKWSVTKFKPHLMCHVLTIKIATRFFARKVFLKPIILTMIKIYNTSRWDPLVDWRIR
jgi:hypothetical protein